MINNKMPTVSELLLARIGESMRTELEEKLYDLQKVRLTSIEILPADSDCSSDEVGGLRATFSDGETYETRIVDELTLGKTTTRAHMWVHVPLKKR